MGVKRVGCMFQKKGGKYQEGEGWKMKGGGLIHLSALCIEISSITTATISEQSHPNLALAFNVSKSLSIL